MSEEADLGGHVGLRVERGPGDELVGAGLRAGGDGDAVDAAVDHEGEVRLAGGRGGLAQRPDFGEWLGHERLATIAREDGHLQAFVHEVEIGQGGGVRGEGVEHEGRLGAEATDRLERGADFAGGFDVDLEGRGPRLGEALRIQVGAHEHQMDAQRQARRLAGQLHDGRAVAEIRHERAVHHVEVQLVGPRILGAADGVGEVAGVGGEQGGQDDGFHGLISSHISILRSTDEKIVLDSFERGEWKPVANREREIARHVRYHRNGRPNNRSRRSRQSASMNRDEAPPIPVP